MIPIRSFCLVFCNFDQTCHHNMASYTKYSLKYNKREKIHTFTELIIIILKYQKDVNVVVPNHATPCHTNETTEWLQG